MKGIATLQGEIIAKQKNTLKSLKKIFFYRTCRGNSIKLSTNYSWVKGIQVCSNKGPGPPQRGDNYKKCENGVGSFKNFLLKNCWPRKAEIYRKAF
jgi:hypothetical protein